MVFIKLIKESCIFFFFIIRTNLCVIVTQTNVFMSKKSRINSCDLAFSTSTRIFRVYNKKGLGNIAIRHFFLNRKTHKNCHFQARQRRVRLSIFDLDQIFCIQYQLDFPFKQSEMQISRGPSLPRKTQLYSVNISKIGNTVSTRPCSQQEP